MILSRPQELVNRYMDELDKHILDLKTGKVDMSMEINELAEISFVHPVHLSNTVKEVTGKSACAFYEEKLVDAAKELITTTNRPINEIAHLLTFDPSNFTKFFKRYTGTTPKQFRKSEGLTILT
jgi:AraC family transcriptional regulator, regulatory protein of adaptative response / methylphosphotriester-DNA alkyltransferase methyltransferase